MTGLLIALMLAAGALVLATPSGRSTRPAEVPGERDAAGGIEDGPLILDLLAAMLSAGASVESALAVVARSCEPGIRSFLTRVHTARLLGASWDAAWDAGAQRGPSERIGRSGLPPMGSEHRGPGHDIRQGLRFATATGAPSAALLYAHAAQVRRRYNHEVDRRAAALGVQLVLPLGLCSLPAFICLGVVPVVLGLLPDL